MVLIWDAKQVSKITFNPSERHITFTWTKGEEKKINGMVRSVPTNAFDDTKRKEKKRKCIFDVQETTGG